MPTMLADAGVGRHLAGAGAAAGGRRPAAVHPAFNFPGLHGNHLFTAVRHVAAAC
jgi:hypothetical protein